ncbi:hypothetical protein M441DRAFT_84299 [Trichoderma asperellum CBS 433.97]|uniref:Alkyl hydroperoxide reductase subunit C/ Thiol specific antioxidant domain-containing protein n=1 Tax=Trichoderma asperellum (strain ATCC 204424 / CBS 433.97 / NBRC 101777) TaxID=1042311 RepID=A0A2T3YT08_TRIA4|nr:hypothetical protein M441DRAFT_84299 [Trichoderma asperellum CBS 433.97]PTB35711.1 hypothetical protein M441DRAFT_84299 [Trichoderma asperellum CBS 433.97]
MISSLTTKIALRKVGLSGTNTSLDFSSFTSPSSSSPASKNDANNNNSNNNWSSWMTPKSLPLKVHPWFSPPPPPVKVAPVPRIGDVAPQDRQRRLELGRRNKCLVVFLRCVGCAFAQKTFLTLRAIANRHAGSITCIAISHASSRATSKWIDMLGGAWNVQIVIDQERAIYAAWGLGVASSLWYVLGPTAQVQAWKETGWLGEKVASAIDAKRGSRAEERRVEAILTPRKKGGAAAAVAAAASSNTSSKGSGGGGGGESETINENNPSTELGSKWQEAGAFAIDGTGTVVWGGKAVRADDVMDLEEGAKLLML